ncbi:hypothetical protein Anapl_06904 [Anas platyrhynchos]|uniref:Uncharacterized protein n=1 Tax=Anas platyrhynchos TaxID=8839 RepID=R0JSI1_ANAPL|nr:hypothetical protein Anapl_06904 [Anas platyrhynchos]
MGEIQPFRHTACFILMARAQLVLATQAVTSTESILGHSAEIHNQKLLPHKWVRIWLPPRAIDVWHGLRMLREICAVSECPCACDSPVGTKGLLVCGEENSSQLPHAAEKRETIHNSLPSSVFRILGKAQGLKKSLEKIWIWLWGSLELMHGLCKSFVYRKFCCLQAEKETGQDLLCSQRTRPTAPRHKTENWSYVRKEQFASMLAIKRELSVSVTETQATYLQGRVSPFFHARNFISLYALTRHCINSTHVLFLFYDEYKLAISTATKDGSLKELVVELKLKLEENIPSVPLQEGTDAKAPWVASPPKSNQGTKTTEKANQPIPNETTTKEHNPQTNQTNQTPQRATLSLAGAQGQLFWYILAVPENWTSKHTKSLLHTDGSLLTLSMGVFSSWQRKLEKQYFSNLHYLRTGKGKRIVKPATNIPFDLKVLACGHLLPTPDTEQEAKCGISPQQDKGKIQDLLPDRCYGKAGSQQAVETETMYYCVVWNSQRVSTHTVQAQRPHKDYNWHSSYFQGADGSTYRRA